MPFCSQISYNEADVFPRRNLFCKNYFDVRAHFCPLSIFRATYQNPFSGIPVNSFQAKPELTRIRVNEKLADEELFLMALPPSKYAQDDVVTEASGGVSNMSVHVT